MPEPIDVLAEGLWTRLRGLLIALDRVDRLEDATEFAGWIEEFERDDQEIDATAQAWVLRALRLASDPINYRILQALEGSEEQGLQDLMGTTHLTRVDLTERVKELAQAGYIAQSSENDAVRGTAAAQAMVAWVEGLGLQIAARARKRLVKDNPLPRPHRLRVLPKPLERVR